MSKILRKSELRKPSTLVRLLSTVIIIVALLYILAILLSPLFEETNKGGYFNERDNGNHIVLALATITATVLYWLDCKNKQLINSHIVKICRFLKSYYSNEVRLVLHCVILLLLIAAIYFSL
jgi:hypothetical protein